MKRNYVVDSDVESDLIEYFDEERSEIEILESYLKKMKNDERFSMIEEVERFGSRVVLNVDGIYGPTRVEVKVVEVPAML